MSYPTPNHLPTPDEIQRSREAAEVDNTARRPLREDIEDAAVIVGGIVVHVGIYTGIQAATAEGQDAFRDHYNTIGSLERENEALYSTFATLPKDVKVTHKGKEIATRIDAVTAEIADTKYNYTGGIDPIHASFGSVAIAAAISALAVAKSANALRHRRNTRAKI